MTGSAAAASALTARLLERATFETTRPLCCAVSGGADSLALLVLACATSAPVEAVHVDHGLRPGSANEADVVAAAAERFGARFRSVKVRVEPGANLEARARAARYAALPDHVLTGHTADDQAETVLLAMLRGSAWHGLGAMRPGPARPLLGIRRHETAELCAELGLEPVSDPSNDDPAHLRNRVRAELVPLLADLSRRDPVPVLTRQAGLMRQAASLLRAEAASIDPTDATGLAAAPELLAREAIRGWLWEACGTEHPPDLATVDRVLDVARLDARATEVGGGWRVRRSQLRLHLEHGDRGEGVEPLRSTDRGTADG